MADKPVRYIIEGDASKLKGEFKELASMAKGLSASIKGVKDALAAVKSQSTAPAKKKATDEEKEALRATRSRIDELRRSLKLSEDLRRQNEKGAQQRVLDYQRIGKAAEDTGKKQREIDEAWARRTAQRTALIDKQRKSLEALASSSRVAQGVPKSETTAPSSFPFQRPPVASGKKSLLQIQTEAEAKAYAQRELQTKNALVRERQIAASYADLKKQDLARVTAETNAAWKKRESDYATHVKNLERIARQESADRKKLEAEGLREFQFAQPPRPAGTRSLLQVEKSLERQAAAASKLKNNINGATSAFSNFGTKSNNILANTARRIKDVVTALIIFDTLRALRDGIRDTFTFITEANQKVEDARIGIASTLTVAGEFVDQFGRALPIAEQIRISLAEADALIPKLLEISAGRGLNFDALLQTQTATAGFTRAAGFTPDETVETIAAVAFFGEKIGVSQSRIIKTLDNIIKGYRVQQTELGTALGLDSKRVEEMRKQGTLAKGLLELLKGTAEAQKQNLETLTGVKNALEAQKTILAQSVASGFFASVEKSYKTVLEAITEINASPESLRNIKGVFDEIGKDIESITKSLSETATTLAGQDLAGAYREIKDTLSQGLVDGSVGWLLAGILQFGGVLPAGRVVKAASAGAAVVAGQSGVGPRDFFNFGSSAFDLAGGFNSSPSDLASGLAALRAMRESGNAIRAQGGGGSLDDLVQALIIGRAPSGTGRSGTFRARPQPGGDSAGGRGGRVRERTLEQAVNERAEFVRREEDSIRAQLEALEKSDEVRLSSARSRLDIAESELSIIEASERPLNEQLAAQQGIFDLKLAQIDLEKQLTAERIRAIQAEIDGGLSQQAEFDLKSEIFELEKRLNDLATERIVLTNENTAAIERQIRSQSESASTLGDIIKGLRDGASFDDILGDIGKRSADKFIDNFLTQKLNVLDPAIEGNFLDVIPKALTQGGKDGLSGLGKLFSGATAAGGKTPVGSAVLPDGTEGALFSDGTVGPTGGSGGISTSDIGAGLGSVVSGASAGAGFASLGGIFGASKKEQNVATIGGSSVGAIGSAIGFAIGGPAGGMIGGAIGGLVGTIGGYVAEALGIIKGPSSSRVIRKSIDETLKAAGLPDLARDNIGSSDTPGALAAARLLSLNEQGQERKLGRGGFDVFSASSDIESALFRATLGLSARDKEIAASRFLGVASGGLNEGIGRLLTRRTERLFNIQDRATKATNSIGSTGKTYIKVGNERIPLELSAIEDYVSSATAAANESFRNEVASLIDGIDEIPKAVDGARLALDVLGADGTANIQQLKESIEDTASLLENGFTSAIKKISEGSNLRDALKGLEESYSSILIDRFSGRFLETAQASPQFTEAVALGERAIDALLAGDTATAMQLSRDSRVALNDANIESAGLLADYSPFLRDINQSYGGSGIVMPLGAPQGNEEVTYLLQQINDNLSQGRSVSVYAQTQGGNVTISSREISDAERNATARQSSGSRRPDPMVGVRA